MMCFFSYFISIHIQSDSGEKINNLGFHIQGDSGGKINNLGVHIQSDSGEKINNLGFHIQGDSGRRSIIWDVTGTVRKTVRMSMFLILNKRRV
jgi:hypothetical protein